MTTIYFVRHAEPNYENHNDFSRELSAKGWKDRELVVDYFSGVPVDAVFSSPFKRAWDTIQAFADARGLAIKPVYSFRERKVGSWIDHFGSFAKKQWEDFEYKLPGGESLREVQNRNVSALKKLLDEYCGKTVVIGSHGTALSTVIHYFRREFAYEDFEAIRNLMPWVVRFQFEGEECVGIYSYDLFQKLEKAF